MAPHFSSIHLAYHFITCYLEKTSAKRQCPLVIESEDRRIKCYAVLSKSKHNQELLVWGIPNFRILPQARNRLFWTAEGIYCFGSVPISKWKRGKMLALLRRFSLWGWILVFKNIPLESLVFFRTINDLFNICRKSCTCIQKNQTWSILLFWCEGRHGWLTMQGEENPLGELILPPHFVCY